MLKLIGSVKFTAPVITDLGVLQWRWRTLLKQAPVSGATAQSSASILIYDRGHSLHNCNRRNKDKQHTLLLALTINSLMFINMMGY